MSGYLGVGQSSGSGFIISADGFIVTNAHVVANATDKNKIVVTMKGGQKRRAYVHSLDSTSDIALVKFHDRNFDDELPTVKLGNSSKLKPGEFVIAIGSPMQLQNSVSFGIVSATARLGSELGISKNRSEYIQTDAAINVGNSGGPLINLDGEVIGISAMKLKGVDGISFAIPIDTAIQIIDQLKGRKRVIRPFVGLRLANYIDKSRINGSGSDEEQRCVILTDVVRDSPAEAAGLQSGDIILSANDKRVRDVKDIFDVIGLDVGKRIEFKVRRGHSQSYQVLKFTFVTAPERSR